MEEFNALPGIITAALALSMFALVVTWLTEGKRHWEFFPDRIEYEQSVLMLSAERKSVPFQNIVSITEDSGWTDALMRTSTLKFSLSGMKEELLFLRHTKNGNRFVPAIQQLLNTFRAQQAAQASMQDTLNRTVDQLYGNAH